MMKYILIITLLLFFNGAVNAHYVWIEKHNHNTANVYFGERHKDLLEKSKKLKKFSSAIVFSTDEKKYVTLQLQEDHLQANINTENDVRMLLSSLPPRESKRDGSIRKTYYYAKTGRQETKSVMTFEMVPTVSGGNQLTLLFNDEPLERAEVIVYGPPKWQQAFRTNEDGQITIETPWAGTYLIKASHKIEPESGKSTLQNPTIRHQFTWTMHVKNGIKW